ncbi:MAG TPA: hypothetical protein VI007_06920 [bacterium]
MVRIAGIVVILLLVASTALAASPPPSAPGAQIEAVSHDARGPLSAGARLTVRLVGTSGGTATFHLVGIASGVGMRETRSSRDQQTASYVGTYVIRPGDAARIAGIIGTLKVGEKQAVKAGAQPVIIDARPPEITDRQPGASARIANLRPNIVVRFHDGETAVVPSRVALLVNGQDVTRRTAITGAFAAYTPQVPFRPGPVRVQALIRDRAGNTTRAEWTFAVAAPTGLISSVTVSSPAGLKPRDYLSVVMVGAPAGQAMLAITGAAHDISMSESAQTPGVYVGMYPIRNADQGRIISVSARLQKGKRSSAASAVAAIPIFGWTPRPTIAAPVDAPRDGQSTERMVVTGRARPAFRVLGLLSARVDSSPENAWIPLAAGLTSARADGNWRLSMGSVAPWPGIELFLTVVAIDPLGQRSPPVTRALGGLSVTPPRVETTSPPSDTTKTTETAPGAGSPAAPAPSPAPPQEVQCPGGQADPETGVCAAPSTGTAGSSSPPPVAAPPPAPPSDPQYERPDPERPAPEPPEPPDPQGPKR